MTSITGYIQPSRRPGELGVHSLNDFFLTVPDLRRAEDFYRAFGLDVRQKGNNIELFTIGHSHCWGRVSEGGRKALGHLSFGVYEDELDAFKVHIEAQGVRLLDPPLGVVSNSLWFRDHGGLLIEVRAAEKTSPSQKSDFQNVSAPAGVASAPGRSAAALVQPRRLAHMLVFTTDISQAIAFYSKVLGLRLSDRSGNGVCFMHGIHGSDHHLIAFAKSGAPGLHHCSWDVGSIDEIGRGAMQMADKGFTRGWGLGRHVLGSNYFHYVRDPWGSYCEYSADIDYIPSTQEWEAGDHPSEDSIYLWGPEMPEDFVHNYESSL